MRKSTPFLSCKDIFGSGRIGPSNPVLPCTCSAVISGLNIGDSEPAKTFNSDLPANSQIILAFLLVRFNGTFPATVVIPRQFSSLGLANAKNMATASS